LSLKVTAGAQAPRTAQSFEEDFMNLRLVVALCLFAAIPAVGYAQPAAPQGQPPMAPAPTLADVQKVVAMINGDKAKVQIYCQLAKLNDQMEAAYQKKDNKTIDTLSAQAEALAQKLGPDYAKVMDGLPQVDENSALGKQMGAALETLDKQCSK
jgi:hypothetical protein